MAEIEQSRAVVEAEETFDGRIIPDEQAELGRPVRLRDGAVVQGSVYGGTVEADDGVTVEGSIMAAEGIELDGAHVGGEVGSPDKVLATDTHIDGTVTGQRVRLTDCVVRGNVVGANVILEDCIVLGIATAERELAIEESLCYTFRSQGETTLENTTLVLPQAIAEGPLELTTPVAVAGLGQIEVDDADDGPAERLPEMGADDLYEQDGTTYLTLAPRILNLEKITERLEELEDAVMAAVDDTSGDDGTEMSVDDVLSLFDIDLRDGTTPG